MADDSYAMLMSKEHLADGSLGRYTPFDSTKDPLEVMQLMERMQPRTHVGRVSLLTDLLTGIPSESIAMRQEATDELSGNTAIIEAIEGATSVITENERRLALFLSENPREYYHKGEGYFTRQLYDAARKALKQAVGLSELDHDKLESRLLRGLFGNLEEFAHTDSAKLLSGKVYRTPTGLRPHDSKWRYTPFRLGYNGRPYTGRVAGFYALLFASIVAYRMNIDPVQIEQTREARGELSGAELAFTTGIATTAMIPMLMAVGNINGDVVHRPMFINPVREAILDEDTFESAVQAYTELDVLAAMARYKLRVTENGSAVTSPGISDNEQTATLTAKGLRNPILAYDGVSSQVIPNDINVDGLTHLTGPNSGGKSTIVKALLLSQMMAEAGAPVAAEYHRSTRADYIHYMVPGAPDLNEKTGRFGHELRELKDIFEKATPRSLIGLDDCMDGTTHEERLIVLGNALRGFNAIGSRLIFSTHAVELVQESANEGIGQQLQVEFDGENPTHRIIDGVSLTSHADRVARIVGMDERGINDSLRRRGYGF